MYANHNDIPEEYLPSLAKSDEVSPSFCSAKWHMVSMNLIQGKTQSCYHPRPHAVPLEEIQRNPAALHNTEFKKSQRVLMLQGQSPKECDFCWNMEDLNKISDRVMRNYEPWSKDDIDLFKQYNGSEDVYPRWLEVNFSHTCNFKCSYCNPGLSSKWLEEIRAEGGYNTSSNFNAWATADKPLPFILEKEDNPYIDAFWKWIPAAFEHLRVFKVTGGEPLLSKHTFRLIEYIKQHPNPELEFVVNSNLGVPDQCIDDLIAATSDLRTNNTVKIFKVITSVDSVGSQAEYQRNGLDFEVFHNNIIKILTSINEVKITFSCTYNIFSVPKTQEFVAYMKSLMDQFPGRINFDMPYLRTPMHQCIQILPDEYGQYILDAEQYMINNGFNDTLIAKLNRLYHYMTRRTFTSEQIATYRKDFVIFVDEHDRRRGTNFLATFPEFADFYDLCKKERL